MRTLKTLLFLGALAPLAVPVAVAQDEDSPAAVEETQRLNEDQLNRDADDDAQYNVQQQQYREQEEQYRAQQEHYESQAERYLAARDRYAAERARYHRGDWPSRYEHLTLVDTDELIGAPVETYTGRRVGEAEEVARTPGGRIDAVRVKLDDGDSDVWIDRGDLKYDTGERVLVTVLARHDLYSMSREQY